ncbi:MAG TPA: NAD-dependent epimerase/dehydratase family protein, partial [Planctomycetes bacterium]|nr:NAD-dependent epimerase/dehydratase family protein [Planctomycetota bacterium]
MSRRALITGGAGFIGSHLAERLLGLGQHVTVVDDESTGRSANLATFRDHERFQFVSGSVSEATLVAELVASADDVYHLAAAVGVALIAQRPIETIERNIYPTQLLLNELKVQHSRGRDVRFFLASTSEVYGKNPKETWTEEDDLVLGATTRPRWAYGASKAIDEFLTLAHWRESNLPVIIGRFFNVVGPRQTGAYGMVLPRFVTAAVAGEPIIVHDDGEQIRCFAHVADVVRFVIELVELPAAHGQVINIGSAEPVSIRELAERVIEIAGSKSKIQFESYADAYDKDFEDVRRRIPDV